MNTIKEIADKLKTSDDILLFPHVHADGDALGSATALAGALRAMGKNCWVLLEDEIADNLKFLDQGICTDNPLVIENPSLCSYIDCGDEGRIPKRYEKFISAEATMCIDHHRTSAVTTDYAYIDPDAAATGEIIYDIICEMGVEIDKNIGEALYAAISTDTGNFQYSNCTKRTHEIAAALYDSGMDHNKVSIEIYENISSGKLKLDNMIMNTLELFSDGKAAVAYLTQDMLIETGTKMDEAEGIAATLRSIRGVEISVFLKEYGPEEIKVSMRAKTYGNVAWIAEAFKGGGHIKAAGCTLYTDIKTARKMIMEKVIESLE